MSEENWCVNKNVPVAVLVAVAAYTVTAICFLADFQNNVATNNERIVRDELPIEILEK